MESKVNNIIKIKNIYDLAIIFFINGERIIIPKKSIIDSTIINDLQDSFKL